MEYGGLPFFRSRRSYCEAFAVRSARLIAAPGLIGADANGGRMRSCATKVLVVFAVVCGFADEADAEGKIGWYEQVPAQCQGAPSLGPLFVDSGWFKDRPDLVG